MPPPPRATDVVDACVVGGGVVGLTAAWRLAEAGVSVLVMDPEPGRGASWAAAGMLAPTTELTYTEREMLRRNLAARALWDDHAAALAAAGHDVGYVRSGCLMVARDADDAAELRRLLDVMVQEGLDVQWLRSREARAIEPALDTRVRGAIRVDGDAQVDNRALMAALTAVCEHHPRVRLRRVAAAALERRDGGISAVRTTGGEVIDAGAIVVAAGAHSGRIAGVPADVAATVRPVKGQILHLRAPSTGLVTRTIRGLRCYLVTRPDGRMVVGATMEEQGFDTSVTAGGVHGILRAAWELVPGITEATFVEATAGLRPGTADNQPIVRQHPEHPRLVIATGHYRHGILHSPMAARQVVAAVTGRGERADAA